MKLIVEENDTFANVLGLKPGTYTFLIRAGSRDVEAEKLDTVTLKGYVEDADGTKWREGVRLPKYERRPGDENRYKKAQEHLDRLKGDGDDDC